MYQVTRKDFNTDFDRMTKAEVIKLTLELLAKLKECQNDRNSLEIELKAMKTTQL